MQKQHTKSIQEILDDTNTRLQRMEREYVQQTESTVRFTIIISSFGMLGFIIYFISVCVLCVCVMPFILYIYMYIYLFIYIYLYLFIFIYI